MNHNNIPNTQGRMKLKRSVLAASTSALLLALAACGGGGSDSTPSTPSAPNTPSQPVANQPVMDVPAPTYAADSLELVAYNLLKSERARCGFGMPAQNKLLDQAARNHAEWVRLNGLMRHEETPGTPGFTGVTPSDRARAVGYVGGAGENISAGGMAPWQPLGSIPEQAVRRLLSIPYHASSMIGLDAPHIGFGFSELSQSGTRFMPVVFGFPNSPQGHVVSYAPGEVKTYPCEGTTDVVTMIGGYMGVEFPNPLPGRDKPSGPALLAFVSPGMSIELGGATLVHVASGQQVPLLPPVMRSNDPNPAYHEPNMAYYIPDVPLAKYARYQFTFSGKAGSMSFTKTYSFTTGGA